MLWPARVVEASRESFCIIYVIEEGLSPAESGKTVGHEAVGSVQVNSSIARIKRGESQQVAQPSCSDDDLSLYG